MSHQQRLPTLRRSSLPVVVGLSAIVCAGIVRAEDRVDFNRDIRPILSENCFYCHGPDAAGREADLRLDVEATAKESAIVAGDALASELIRRVTIQDESERMPPLDSERSLTPEQIALLTRWVTEGAEYQSHWSFIPPTKPTAPTVSDKAWSRHEIDRFVLAKLEAADRKPSAEATKETLLRRVTFDLTGLPPTLDDIDAFLADDSSTAYETVVDRLLSSDAYGERMTTDWLDVARYSDTYGMQVDRDRFVWPWRDWVIRAFNANMPYDEFVTKQLAGDLLPNADRDDILATTFCRLHPQETEGGSVPEEFRMEYVADRTQTFATAFLGLTMECCRCHDHKYDPLSQKEYYSLSAYFDNIDEAGLYSFFTSSTPTPTLLLPTDQQTAEIDQQRQKIAEAETQLRRLAETMKSGTQQSAFEDWQDREHSLHSRETDNKDDKTKRSTINVHVGQVATLDFESPPKAPNEHVAGRIGKGVKLTGDDGITLEVGNFKRYEPFSVSLWMNTPDVKDRAVVFHRSRAWTDAGSRGYQLLIEDGKLSWSLIHFWPGNAIRIRTVDTIPTQNWQHITVTNNGSSRADGLTIFIDGKPAKVEIVQDNLSKQITGGGGDNITIGERFRDRGFKDGLVDEFQVFDRELTPIEIAHLHDGHSLTDALNTKTADRTPEQRDALVEFYLSTVDPAAAAARDALQTQRGQLADLVDAVQEIMVMRERSDRRPSYLRLRGTYDALGDAVSPTTPAALGNLPNDKHSNRLGLAEWLTDPKHPLTARVAVNRFWQMCFGNGLVTTPEDFGSQGRLPTHPELLDWLAVDFVEHGWDTKRLLKQIVTSATYRQSSALQGEFDPENKLLGRGPSYRLPAEMLRDNALALSGLLVDKIGGSPVKPYDLEESFKPSEADKGDGLYRRSLYTYWRRNGPAPAMMTFDASQRDVCRVRREQTASPLQSLVMLNGPQFNEAARATAERLIAKHPDDRSALLTDLFRLTTSRSPGQQELDVLQSLYNAQRAKFDEQPKSAVTFLSIGERPRDESFDAVDVAAIATVVGTLMNYHEGMTKR